MLRPKTPINGRSGDTNIVSTNAAILIQMSALMAGVIPPGPKE